MTQDHDAPEPLRFGYAGPASGRAYDSFREEFCRHIMKADVAPIRDGELHCEITPVVLPSLKLSGSGSSPLRYTTLGADDCLVVLLAPDAALHAVMGSRDTTIVPGAIGLADGQIRGAHVDQLDDGHLKTLVIERRTLLQLCPGAESHIGRTVPAGAGVATLLYQYYDMVAHNAHRFDAPTAAAVAQHLIDLAALALGARDDAADEASRRGLAAARFEAIRADLLARLGDGELSITDLARRHRASVRYVQLLFERHGSTFSQYLLEQRLLLAARLLKNPTLRARKISDIAHLAGFNDLSHFYREFRRRFGVTPSDMRLQSD